ncbi:MAG: patatin-like phospholipase family protein [Rhodobacteraceae bacterium]|nr:patatin-like phospholipase family protein [Paracoccaceae bacterium]
MPPENAARRPAAPTVVRLELALQGGGAHGAFTWGVLDRLLDEPRLQIVAISGASAGAMNAVLVAHGLGTAPGPAGAAAAQKALWKFWKGVSRSAAMMRGATAALDFMAPPQGLSGVAFGPFALWSASHAAWRTFAERAAGRHGRVPEDLNPLGPLLDGLVDFEALRQPTAVRLFLSATDVATGALRVFRNADLSASAVLASACLPQLFRAVEIDGRAYWDGGYLANPPLAPLIAESAADDLLVVQLNPTRREALDEDADAILARVNEISFNASLVNELRGILTLRRALALAPPGFLCGEALLDKLSTLRLHRIAATETEVASDGRGRMNPEWSLLQRLHGAGQRAADVWLQQNGDSLGRVSTLDDTTALDFP